MPIPEHPLSHPCSWHISPALWAVIHGQTLWQVGTPSPSLCHHPPPKSWTRFSPMGSKTPVPGAAPAPLSAPVLL